MDNTSQEEQTVVTEATVENVVQPLQADNIDEMPELNFNLERKNSHGDDMPSLDNLNVSTNETNTESVQEEVVGKEVLIQNTAAEISETVAEISEIENNSNTITNTDDVPELILSSSITETTNPPLVDAPTPQLEDISEEIQSSKAQIEEDDPKQQPLEIQEEESGSIPVITDATDADDVEKIKKCDVDDEVPEQNTVEITEITEEEYSTISVDQNALEEEEENSNVQIITPDDPPIDEVLTENIINFSHDQPQQEEEEVPNSIEESNLSNVEYGVILNDNQTTDGGISMNGVHNEITKQELGIQDGCLYEDSTTVIKVDQDSGFNPETIGDIVTIASEVQHNTDDTIITLPSDTVTEVTFSNVEMLESHEGVVTINQLTEQSGQQVVLLPEDQVILMETEEYDQPESIAVNVLENEEEETLNEEEIEESEEDRKSINEHPNIPCHVLGRSIDNPLVDPVRNGRVLLKPRLGVKIPYRNLTSQIVSKQEIAEEIMERSRLRQSAAEPPAGGDVFFAKKLTQRLAKKLVPPNRSGSKSASSKNTASTSASSSNKKTGGSSENKLSSKTIKTEITVANVKVIESPKSSPSSTKIINSNKTTTVTESPKNLDASDKVIDNSDLIALLEGDDVPDWNIVAKSSEAAGTSTPAKTDVKRSADWEREIALKQLKELPKHSRGGGGGSVKGSSSKYISNSPPKEPSQEPKESTSKETVDEEKDDLNIEPRFSSNTVVKTYTRKRKPFPEELKPPTSTPAQSGKKASEDKSSSVVQKQQPPVLSPLKPSSPNVHKHPPVLSAQKSPPATAKGPTNTTTTTSAQKSAAASPKSSSSSNVQKLTTQKISSSSSSSPAAAQKQALTSVAQKTPQPAKKLSEEKKEKGLVQEKKLLQEKISVQEKKTLMAEKRRSSTPSEIDVPSPVTESKQTLSPNTYISKSSRIVKRKKIWDPDEATPATKVTIKSPKLMESPEKPVASPKLPEKKLKPVAAAVLKPSNEKLPPPKSTEKTELPAPKPKLGRPVTVLKPNNEKPTTVLKKVKKIIGKKTRPKRLTEVDKLLMDEGAVNLLYSVKNTEEIQNMKRKKKNKTLISLDRAQRELQNKTNEIKNDLQMNSTKDSPISLRKKEGGTPKSSPVKDLAATVLHRKKSKDSMSGSVHSPPASPGFAYSQHADASRIIRRHSSSSFSSENSEEVDEEEEEEQQEEGGKQTEKIIEKKNKGEQPQKKKAKLNHEKQAKPPIGVVEKQLLNEEMSKNFNRPPSDDPNYSEFETFNVRKFDNLTQIILASTSANGQTTLSVQVLSELAVVLNALQKDDSCRVVVLSSSGSSFCEGIDYKELASDDEATRKSIAEKFAVSVREFLLALSKFSKLLVAGVHGNTVGLGVTMLPLFDMVLASDTATFSTPYARLGSAAEGAVLLTLPHVMHNALASELFFASRKLTAAEALRLGLVTRTLWPDKFQEELISALKLIAGQSLQSMQAIKKQLRHHLLLNVEASLKSESSILIEHWTSNECQSNFSNYNLENK